MTALSIDSTDPVLHVVVIGFHHKKGCQVEYSFPPLVPGGQVHSNEAPTQWKHLPSLAIPDGAHNYTSDSIYFHLPGREDVNRTVYGVACYRQIEAKDLKIKTDDITRSTVQKSVVVLSYLPLYGLIEAKLELITHAYFKELDFSQVSLLEETYNHLNTSLTESLLDGGSQVYLGMDVKELVITFKHRIVLLFKLIMLERKVLFTGSPVEKLGTAILSILSLFPGMIEYGLVECTSYGVHKHISPTLGKTKLGSDSETEEYLEIRYSSNAAPELTMVGGVDYNMDTVEPSSPIIDRGLDFNRSPAHNNFNPALDNSGTSLFESNPAHFDSNPAHDNTDSTHNNSKPSSSHKNNNILTNPKNKKLQIHSAGKLRNNSDKQLVSRMDSNSSFGSTSSRGRSGEGLELVDDYYGRDSTGMADTQSRSESGSASDLLQQQVVLPTDSDILTGVTSYSAVQAGKSIPKKESVINIEEISEHSLQLEENYFGSLPKDTIDTDGKGSISRQGSEVSRFGSRQGSGSRLGSRSSKTEMGEEKVEELDSPESINQIDQEDCFSWEEDNLSLTINTDKPIFDMSAGLASSFKDAPMIERALSGGSQHSMEVEPEKTGTSEEKQETSPSSPGVKAAAIKNKLSNAFSGLSFKGRLTRNKAGSRETSEPPSPASPELPNLPVLHQDDMGFPLTIFTKGCVCFPYLSLQYYDLMNDVNVRSFVIGATNMLFRQKRHLTDVIVDVSENKLEIHERELQRQLTLTTADLRFADILVKAVTPASDNGYFDSTEWEGNDEWLRAQFKLYLEGMVAAVHNDDAKLIEDYGVSFIQCWKTTHNYKVWSSTDRPALKSVQAGHPCQGNLSVTDIKMRLSHTMQNTEGGKKINAAVSQTGKYVVQTGKAVGGALTSAKSSLSSWFSTWKTSNNDKTSPQDSNTEKTGLPDSSNDKTSPQNSSNNKTSPSDSNTEKTGPPESNNDKTSPQNSNAVKTGPNDSTTEITGPQYSSPQNSGPQDSMSNHSNKTLTGETMETN